MNRDRCPSWCRGITETGLPFSSTPEFIKSNPIVYSSLITDMVAFDDANPDKVQHGPWTRLLLRKVSLLGCHRHVNINVPVPRFLGLDSLKELFFFFSVSIVLSWVLSSSEHIILVLSWSNGRSCSGAEGSCEIPRLCVTMTFQGGWKLSLCGLFGRGLLCSSECDCELLGALWFFVCLFWFTCSVGLWKQAFWATS